MSRRASPICKRCSGERVWVQSQKGYRCKPCTNSYLRNWYKSNPEKVRKYRTNPKSKANRNRLKNEWRKKHPELYRAGNARYRNENRERIRARDREYYYRIGKEKARERIRLNGRPKLSEKAKANRKSYFNRYRKRCPDKIRNKFKRWEKKQREKLSDYYLRRYKKFRNDPRSIEAIRTSIALRRSKRVFSALNFASGLMNVSTGTN